MVQKKNQSSLLSTLKRYILFASVLFWTFGSQIDQPLINDRGDVGDVIDEPFVNYQERMTRAMKELTKKGHDMVSKTEHVE